MTIFVVGGLVLSLLALAFVLYPLLRSSSERVERRLAVGELTQRRQELYRQILEVEFDQRVGKMSEADGRELSESLLRQAAELLSQESTVEHELEVEVEREIEALRRALTASPEPRLGVAEP